ncbi:biogenesis of lysosome-related organelles complex 1 subunit 4-like isoform X1 [Portunus trituberculatus]|uniref:biogenesis of lysosome-related organelles complex 1 subunit 4-like isoform X1 n=1 Tax=Portunus trituberculatus TaxID=210409 RepID=UPI001E1CE494|nr:biogenesis of lysosome-related organelles complex 1 subunit 4-like isoform X1 [Portunus trituberculatus]XP_045137039.1 biogenesis of lysosome-related organelles complex 1 subunit 4-like isoform X1 [Portunus trituberculatus]XP_045137040.1 biogenesis of lysosome-related organelles complex 1 subunit 4-like isoform X1 [Portunus trituberculatus]
MEDKLQQNKLLEQMAKDYAPYFKVDKTAEKAQLDCELETMLIRLEEYGSLLERTRSESRHTLDVLVPQIYSHYQSLQRTFQTIDQLEVLVGRVKEDLTKMEKAVSKAESQLGSTQGFTTVMKPFFFMSHQVQERPSSSQLTFEPPDIFKTEDYFVEELETQTSISSRT